MEAAVPPYTNDPALSAQTVGELHLYVRQLSTRITEIAEQANRLDDRRIELEQRAAELEAELAAAHRHNDELRTRIDHLEATHIALDESDNVDCTCCP